MHVLFCVAVDDGPGPTAESVVGAAAAAELADVWRRAAPRCVVETVEFRRGPARAGEPAPARPAGVFVPIGALGLASAQEAVPPDVARLRERIVGADLVVVHVPELDADALAAGPVASAAAVAAPQAVPVVVLADRDRVTRREWSAAGISGVHELGPAGPRRAEAVARVARTWAPAWSRG